MQKVTIKEASFILGISVEAVKWRIKNNKLKSEKVNNRIYVFLEDNIIGSKNGAINELLIKNNEELKNKNIELLEELEKKNRFIQELLMGQKIEIKDILVEHKQENMQLNNKYLKIIEDIVDSSKKFNIESQKDIIELEEIEVVKEENREYISRKDDFITLKEYLKSINKDNKSYYEKFRKKVANSLNNNDKRFVKVKNRYLVDKTADLRDLIE